jgi:hypothetical protein
MGRGRNANIPTEMDGGCPAGGWEGWVRVKNKKRGIHLTYSLLQAGGGEKMGEGKKRKILR